MLLMTLDQATAASLLHDAGPELATELAAELATLEISPDRKQAAMAQMIRELLQALMKGKSRSRGMSEFKAMLETALGAEQSQQVLTKANRIAASRDPFAGLREIPVPQLKEALAGEGPAVIALVLGDLPASKSSELLGLLPETVRPEIIKAMAVGEAASAEIRLRIATAIQQRLKAANATDAVAGPVKNDRLRRLAMLLRVQPPEQRQSLIESLTQQNADAAKQVNELMVIWDDLPTLADRSLQEGLRVVDTRKLAMALVGADEKTTLKIRQNISERARASLDEEMSLLSKPTPKEVEEGRVSLLEALREINAATGLRFEGD